MKSALFRVAACAVWLLVNGNVVAGKEWQGIVPLKSTRADVERILGAQKESTEWISYYKLANQIVVVHFEADRCDTETGKFGYGWNVPAGTVTSIALIPRGTHRVEEYKSATNFAVSDDGAGFVHYRDESAGLAIETYKNVVTLVEYSPEAAQQNLRCPQTYTCCIDFFTKFDEYTNISFADEKARLDNFWFQLNSGFARGTIQVLGRSPKDREQRLKRAVRAKNYLVRQRGLEPERLLILDGGYNEENMTRLTWHSIGGVATTIIVFREKDPVNTTPALQRKLRPPRF